MICPKCGRDNMNGIILCPYCGASLKAEDNDNKLKDQRNNADVFHRQDAMISTECENRNVPDQFLFGHSQNKKAGIQKELFIVGAIVILMAVFFGADILGFDGRTNQNIAAEFDKADEKKDIIENIHESISESVSSEKYAVDSSYGEKQNLTEENLSETGGKEVIEVYGGIKAPAEDFVFPYSSQKILTDEELLTLESDDPQTMHDKSQQAINEVFARYGYTFGSTTKTSRAAKERFEALDWYTQVQKKCPSNSWWTLQTEYFNENEVQNIQILNEWQKQHGVSY